MKALVLSGGSIKGAFQAGAIRAILNRGFKPDIICGISVGSLNATYMAYDPIAHPTEDGISWSIVGENLVNFWRDNVTGPATLIRKRLPLELAFDALFNNFNGLNDNEPLARLLRKNVDFEALKAVQKPIIKVGAVNLHTAGIEYKSPADENFFQHVMASTAIPIIMPGQTINNQFFLDGGVRDVAPLKIAIQNGATEIVCICCQSETLEPEPGFNPGNIMKYAERLMDTIVNELVNNDIEQARFYNNLLEETQAAGVQLPILENKKIIDLKVIRPTEQIEVNIANFKAADIEKMLDDGERTAMNAGWRWS